jgi:NAD(P)-dependent dehydrogenase (short-subunit alcohol dehydrogenase family)
MRELFDLSGRCAVIGGAGINSARPFFEIPEDEVDAILATNFKATFLACQVFGGYLVERFRRDGRGGSVINMGSMSGLTPLSFVTGIELAVDGGFDAMSI